MASSGRGAKRRGDRAEREIAELMSHHLGITVRRKLGAGRQDDEGDLEGVPDCTVQVADWQDKVQAIRVKAEAADRQAENAGTTFGVAAIRLQGGQWRFVMTPEQFATWAREALPWEATNDTTINPDSASS